MWPYIIQKVLKSGTERGENQKGGSIKTKTNIAGFQDGGRRLWARECRPLAATKGKETTSSLEPAEDRALPTP